MRENVERAQVKQKWNYNQKRKVEDFLEVDLVWVRAHPLSKAEELYMEKLAARWKGLANVCKWQGSVNYLISFLDTPLVVDIIHVQNVKPSIGMVNYSSEGGSM